MTVCFLGVVRSLEHVQIGKMHQVRLTFIGLEERLEMKKGCRAWEGRGGQRRQGGTRSGDVVQSVAGVQLNGDLSHLRNSSKGNAVPYSRWLVQHKSKPWLQAH